MVYLLTFIAIIIIARIAGPTRQYKDPDQELREAEYEHRMSVYGDPEH
jgi:hypothetical protein